MFRTSLTVGQALSVGIPTPLSTAKPGLEANNEDLQINVNEYKGYKVSKSDLSEGIQARYLLGRAVNPEPWRYLDRNEILWEAWRFFNAYGAPLSDDEPSTMMQYDEGWQGKGVL